jgi:hypothetical protein
MAFDPASLVILHELIADNDLTLDTILHLPQNRTPHCRENFAQHCPRRRSHQTTMDDSGCGFGTQGRKHHGQETRVRAPSPDGRCRRNAERWATARSGVEAMKSTAREPSAQQENHSYHLTSLAQREVSPACSPESHVPIVHPPFHRCCIRRRLGDGNAVRWTMRQSQKASDAALTHRKMS